MNQVVFPLAIAIVGAVIGLRGPVDEARKRRYAIALGFAAVVAEALGLTR